MGTIRTKYEIVSDKSEYPVVDTEYVKHKGQWLADVLDGNDTQFETIKEQIEAFETEVAIQASAISRNTTAITGLDTRVTALEEHGGGTSDYPALSNKPSINGITLVGNLTDADLNIVGEQGPKGDTGPAGPQGPAGINGTNGSNGVSCTHTWSGTTLTVTSASGTSSANLKGEKGDKGDTGAAGTNGTNGTNGKDGVTPTIKATNGTNIGTVGTPSVSASTSGTTTTFTFNYLKGEKGDKGDPGQNATTTAVATQSANGLMSSGDKTKLDGIATGATKVDSNTVSGWGYTKNTGTYSKPSTGIPKTDLASDVQTSLGKADTALQSHQSLANYATMDMINAIMRNGGQKSYWSLDSKIMSSSGYLVQDGSLSLPAGKYKLCFKSTIAHSGILVLKSDSTEVFRQNITYTNSKNTIAFTTTSKSNKMTIWANGAGTYSEIAVIPDELPYEPYIPRV